MNAAVAAIGSVLAMAGALGPWREIDAGIASAAMPGTSSSDGQLALALSAGALLLVAQGVAHHPRFADVAALLLLGVAGLGFYHIVQARDWIASLDEDSRGFVGWGLYAIVAGACLGFVSAIIQARVGNQRRQERLT